MSKTKLDAELALEESIYNANIIIGAALGKITQSDGTTYTVPPTNLFMLPDAVDRQKWNEQRNNIILTLHAMREAYNEPIHKKAIHKNKPLLLELQEKAKIVQALYIKSLIQGFTALRAKDPVMKPFFDYLAAIPTPTPPKTLDFLQKEIFHSTRSSAEETIRNYKTFKRIEQDVNTKSAEDLAKDLQQLAELFGSLRILLLRAGDYIVYADRMRDPEVLKALKKSRNPALLAMAEIAQSVQASSTQRGKDVDAAKAERNQYLEIIRIAKDSTTILQELQPFVDSVQIHDPVESKRFENIEGAKFDAAKRRMEKRIKAMQDAKLAIRASKQSKKLKELTATSSSGTPALLPETPLEKFKREARERKEGDVIDLHTKDIAAQVIIRTPEKKGPPLSTSDKLDLAQFLGFCAYAASEAGNIKDIATLNAATATIKGLCTSAQTSDEKLYANLILGDVYSTHCRFLHTQCMLPQYRLVVMGEKRLEYSAITEQQKDERQELLQLYKQAIKEVKEYSNNASKALYTISNPTNINGILLSIQQYKEIQALYDKAVDYHAKQQQDCNNIDENYESFKLTLPPTSERIEPSEQTKRAENFRKWGILKTKDGRKHPSAASTSEVAESKEIESLRAEGVDCSAAIQSLEEALKGKRAFQDLEKFNRNLEKFNIDFPPKSSRERAMSTGSNETQVAKLAHQKRMDLSWGTIRSRHFTTNAMAASAANQDSGALHESWQKTRGQSMAWVREFTNIPQTVRRHSFGL